jgi:WD40 repeat protein
VVREQDGRHVAVVDLLTRQSLRLMNEGEYTVKAQGKGGTVEVEPGRIVIKRGDKVTVTVKRGLVLVKRFQAPERVGEVALSPDGKLALTGLALPGNDGDNDILLWDIDKGVRAAHFKGHTRNVHDLTFTRDSKRFLSCSRDGSVRLWDVATGKEIRQYAGHEGEVWTARISPDDKFVLTGCHDKKIRLFDLETAEEKKVLTGHEGGLVSVEFAPDGRRALSLGHDKTVRLWDLEKGQEIQAWTLDHDGRRVAWSWDGQRFLTCGVGGQLLLWQLNKKQPTLSFEGHGGEHQVYRAGFTPDGRYAVSASGDASVRFWDLKTGREVLREYEKGLGEIFSVELSRDGRYLLSNGGYSKAARLYRLPKALWPDGTQRLAEKKR